MFKESAPRDYVTTEYLEYQKRYAENVRESDKVLFDLIRDALGRQSAGGREPRRRLLDIGCSNGNLLRHLRRVLPGLEYHGADLFPEIIDHCKNDPALAGIGFEVMDIRDLGPEPRFDAVVANAVLHRFNDVEFDLAIGSIARVTCSRGWFFAFDFYHPFEQNLSIVESSPMHPQGLPLMVRPYTCAERVLEASGFRDVSFTPFSIPMDLEKPKDLADMRTFTVRTDDGERLNFRGSFFMPWCYITARKQ